MKFKKIAKSNPAVAQWLSASLGALVNHGLGKSPITGATEAQYATKNNAYGVMLRNDELSNDDDYYYIIDVYGNTYKRTKTGDKLISPSVIRKGTVTPVVKQNPAKGYQSEGQEVFVYPNGSYVNIDQPLGKVHVGSAHLLTNRSSSWDNPTVNNPTVVEETPRVIDEWPEESTGKIYRVYSNSSEPVFTGEYQGNRNLMSGATAVYNPDHKAWYANGYVIYRTAETDSIIRKQSLEQKKESVIEVVNKPDTGIGIMADTVSYMTDYKGLEYGGTAVTFGQVAPKFFDNNSRFESFPGKYLAGVSDFGSEALKARLSFSTANALATAYAGKQVMNPYPNNLSMAQGVLFAISGGVIVNQTISPTINITNEEIKNKIKDIENEWKK